MALSAAVASTTAVHIKQMKRVAELGDQGVMRAPYSNTAAELLMSSAVSDGSQTYLLEQVTEHFDRRCLWAISMHRSHLMLHLKQFSPMLCEFFYGLNELIDVTDEDITGLRLPRKLAKQHYINFLFTIRTALKHQETPSAAAATGVGVGQAHTQQQSHQLVLINGGPGDAFTPIRVVDNLLAALIARLAVLSYDGFGALLPDRSSGWIIAGVKKLLDSVAGLDDLLDASQQPTSERSASALLMLACTAKHGDELSSIHQLSRSLAAAVKALPARVSAPISPGIIVTLRLLLSTVYFMDTVLRVTHGETTDDASHHMLFARIRALRTSTPETSVMQIVIPLLGSEFTEWIFQWKVLADGFGPEIMRHELVAAASASQGALTKDSATTGRFATLLTCPLACESILKLLDAKLVDDSSPKDNACGAAEASGIPYLCLTTCNQVLVTLCNVLDTWQRKERAAFRNSTIQLKFDFAAMLDTLTRLLPPRLARVLNASIHERAMLNVGSSVAYMSTCHTTGDWDGLIQNTLHTLVKFRQVSNSLMKPATSDEIQIARLCAEQSTAQSPAAQIARLCAEQSTAQSPAAQMSRSRSSVQLGMAYVHAILNAIKNSRESLKSAATVQAIDAIVSPTVVLRIVAMVEKNNPAFGFVDTIGALQLLEILVRLQLRTSIDDVVDDETLSTSVSDAATTTFPSSSSDGTKDSSHVSIDADLLVRLTRCPTVLVQFWSVKLFKALLQKYLVSASSAVTPSAPLTASSSVAPFHLSVREGVSAYSRPAIVDRLARGLFLSLQSMIIRGGHLDLQNAACSLLSSVLEWTTLINPRTTQRLIYSEWIKTMVAGARCEFEQARSALQFVGILLRNNGRLNHLVNPKDLLMIVTLALHPDNGAELVVTEMCKKEVAHMVTQLTDLAGDISGKDAELWDASRTILVETPFLH
jgi:hypothetical protein